MKKTSIDYKLTGEYLETYHKASLYLSTKFYYLKDVDSTIVEVTDVLMQAQHEGVPVDEVIDGDLIAFLDCIDSAFSSTPFFKKIYSYLVFAIALVIILQWVDRGSNISRFESYLRAVFGVLSFDLMLRIFKRFLGKKIHTLNVHKTAMVLRFKIWVFSFYFATIVIMPISVLDNFVPDSVLTLRFLYIIFGVSFIPILIDAVINEIKASKEAPNTNSSDSQGKKTQSIKEMTIDKLENNMLKRNTKRFNKHLPLLSDQEVVKILSKNKAIVLILYPMIAVLYFLIITYMVYIQVQDGFRVLGSVLLAVSTLIFLLVFSILMTTRDVSLLIYYLRKRNLEVFEKGAIPKEKLNKEYR